MTPPPRSFDESTQTAITVSPVLAMARRLNAVGISCIPIKTNASKAPLYEWTKYQTAIPTTREIEKWFSEGVGIAVTGGLASGNLEILDFDEPGLYEEFAAAAADQGQEWGELVNSLPRSITPSGGVHLYYRCEEPVGRNKALAKTASGEKPSKARIETRGHGGYALVAPSPAECHPKHRPYVMAHGELDALPVLKGHEVTFLHDLASLFNLYTPVVRAAPAKSAVPSSSASEEGGRLKPGTDYNERGDYEEVLERHGWKRLRRNGGGLQWQRPGKEGIGSSATTDGRRGMYCFTSSVKGFEEDKPYEPFAIYTILEHDGDYKAAASALAAQGFGEPDPRFEQVRQERSEQRDRDALRLAVLRAENSENDAKQVDELVEQVDELVDEKRKNFLFSPETGEKPAGDTLYHVGASFNARLEKAGIRVDGLRLHISPNLDYEVIEKAWNAFIDFESSVTTVTNFWMGQMYDALPKGHARGRIIGARFDGAGGFITRKMMDKYGECARIVRRIPSEFWDARRPWTMYDGVSTLPVDRVSYWLAQKPYKGIMRDIEAEVVAGRDTKKAGNEGVSENRRSISYNTTVSPLYVPSRLAEQITEKAQTQRIDIPSYLHSLIIPPPPPELPPVQLVADSSEPTVSALEARAQGRGISPDAYIAYLLELDAPAPNLMALCTRTVAPPEPDEPLEFVVPEIIIEGKLVEQVDKNPEISSFSSTSSSTCSASVPAGIEGKLVEQVDKNPEISSFLSTSSSTCSASVPAGYVKPPRLDFSALITAADEDRLPTGFVTLDQETLASTANMKAFVQYSHKRYMQAWDAGLMNVANKDAADLILCQEAWQGLCLRTKNSDSSDSSDSEISISKLVQPREGVIVKNESLESLESLSDAVVNDRGIEQFAGKRMVNCE